MGFYDIITSVYWGGFMADDLYYDVGKAVALCFADEDDYYTRIYSRSNENLKALFSNFEVKGKDVLSVLGSSDQVFTARYLGAKSVDSFDINKLALYYYYLRTWLIRYRNMEYPSRNFCEGFDKRIWDFIEEVRPLNEAEKYAKNFWLTYLRRTNGLPNSYLFIRTGVNYPNIFSDDLGKVLADDIDFKHANIYREIDCDKQYDVMILSNILEYTTSHEDYVGLVKNINKLLRDDGICVCSYMMDDYVSDDHYEEVLEFRKLGLEVEEFHSRYSDSFGFKKDVGYAYRKKR